MTGPRFKPSWINQIRFVANYYISGCSAPWGVYADQATPFAKDIAMVFLDFGLRDFVKEFFRPKGLRSKRHGRKGRKTGKSLPGVPDPNELAAKNVPGQKDFASRKYGLGTRVFYAVDDVIDRVSWSIALLEMTSDITYGTLLGVLEQDLSFCPNIRRLWRKGGYKVFGGAGPTWQVYTCGPIQYNVGLSSPIGSLLFLPAGKFSITLGSKLIAPAGAVQCRLRIFQDSPVAMELDVSDYINVSTSEYTDCVLHAVVDGPASISFGNDVVGGFCDSGYDDLMVQEIL